MKKYLLSLALLALSFIPLANAQQASTYSKFEQPWFLQGKVSGGISVGAVTAATALPANGFMAWVCNTGSVDAYLSFGDSTVTTSSTTGTWLKAGTCSTYDLFPPSSPKATFIATISGSSTTLAVETGLGNGPAQSAGGGGSVTQGTSPWVVSLPAPAAPLAAAAPTATGSLLMAGRYTTATPSFTDGQQGAVSFTNDGRLRVGLSSAAPLAPATATATSSNVVGCQYNSTDQAFTNGQQGSIGCDQRGGVYVQDGKAVPSASVSSATSVFTIADTTGYGSISVQVTSAGVGSTITYEASEDGTTWSSVQQGFNSTSGSGNGPISSSTAVGLYLFPITAKQFRARVSSYGSGTITTQGTLRKDQLPKFFVSIAGTKTDGDAAGSGNTGVVVEGRSTDKTAVTNAQVVRPVASLIGQQYFLPGASAEALAGLAPSATSSVVSFLVIKASAGNLYSLDVTAGATSGYVMIFDATAAPADGAVTPKFCFPLGANQAMARSFAGGPPAAFATGITAVFSTTGCLTKTASATPLLMTAASK